MQTRYNSGISLVAYDPCAGTFSVANDWGLTGTQDIDAVLTQPFRILCVRPCFNEPHIFSYNPNLKVNFDQFDLVLVSDIEYTSIQETVTWLQRNGIENYLLALGGQVDTENFDSSSMVYRYHWASQYTLRDTYINTHLDQKPFVFDVLLGARRPHRDFVMLAMTKYNMLDSSIVTYRDCFVGHITDHQTQEFAKLFADTKFVYPYVSPNLESDWEVRPNLTNDISYLIPVEIFQKCYYSVITETLGTGCSFFFSEKAAKAMFAKRLFVAFSNANYYAKLHSLGYETFDAVIDESFDSDPLDFSRFARAIEQMQYLAAQDPVHVLKKVQPVLEHNHHHLYRMIQRTRCNMNTLLRQRVPQQYITQDQSLD
jgi:hypothetical protein